MSSDGISAEDYLRLTRRNLLRQSFISGSLWASGLAKFRWPEALLDQSANARRDGSLLGIVPFSEEGHPAMGEPIGSELDGRLFTELSTLTPEYPVTPTDQFFVRTSASKLLNKSNPWIIRVGGIIKKPITISAEALAGKARPMGIHLMECAGNTRAARFGMLSVAEWDGVSLQEILETGKPQMSGVRVLVSGFDQYKQESMTSTPGASWIFSPEQLSSARAFLATRMNGNTLNADHGAPVRLMVPGWYGCVCIKWVNQIEFVSGDAPATDQMLEYASRTMQIGVPSLARDYQPAIVDNAAMPTRIEKWLVGGKIRYRVMGIQWGGSPSVQAIEIRFNPTGEFVPVATVQPSASDNLTFWSHEWSPPRTGRFTIRLRLHATGNVGRRLNSGYYDRSVDIAEI